MSAPLLVGGVAIAPTGNVWFTTDSYDGKGSSAIGRLMHEPCLHDGLDGFAKPR